MLCKFRGRFNQFFANRECIPVKAKERFELRLGRIGLDPITGVDRIDEIPISAFYPQPAAIGNARPSENLATGDAQS